MSTSHIVSSGSKTESRPGHILRYTFIWSGFTHLAGRSVLHLLPGSPVWLSGRLTCTGWPPWSVASRRRRFWHPWFGLAFTRLHGLDV